MSSNSAKYGSISAMGKPSVSEKCVEFTLSKRWENALLIATNIKFIINL